MTREEWRTRAINHGTELRKVKERLRIPFEKLPELQNEAGRLRLIYGWG